MARRVTELTSLRIHRRSQATERLPSFGWSPGSGLRGKFQWISLSFRHENHHQRCQHRHHSMADGDAEPSPRVHNEDAATFMITIYIMIIMCRVDAVLSLFKGSVVQCLNSWMVEQLNGGRAFVGERRAANRHRHCRRHPICPGIGSVCEGCAIRGECGQRPTANGQWPSSVGHSLVRRRTNYLHVYSSTLVVSFSLTPIDRLLHYRHFTLFHSTLSTAASSAETAAVDIVATDCCHQNALFHPSYFFCSTSLLLYFIFYSFYAFIFISLSALSFLIWFHFLHSIFIWFLFIFTIHLSTSISSFHFTLFLIKFFVDFL